MPDLPPEGGVLPPRRTSLFTDSARFLAAQVRMQDETRQELHQFQPARLMRCPT